jgi:hypothetical protein
VTENNRQQDIRLISDVVQVRTCAIAIAAATNHALLYAAAVANNDQRILELLEELVSEAQAAIAEKEAKLDSSATLIDHILTIARLRDEAERLDALVEIRDTAKANVAQLTSGEGLTHTSTEGLLWLLKEQEEASEMASAQAG